MPLEGFSNPYRGDQDETMGALTGVLVVVVVVAGVVAPALAITTPELTCNTVGAGGSIYRLTATAEYQDSTVTKLRTWTGFRFMVHGGDPDEDHNNVNIRLSEFGDVKFSYNSPDSLEFNRWYSIRPASPVHTCIYGPSGEHDHRSNDVLKVEGIFDMSGIVDPRCTATDRF
jgi:hypothetical protein